MTAAIYKKKCINLPPRYRSQSDQTTAIISIEGKIFQAKLRTKEKEDSSNHPSHQP